MPKTEEIDIQIARPRGWPASVVHRAKQVALKRAYQLGTIVSLKKGFYLLSIDCNLQSNKKTYANAITHCNSNGMTLATFVTTAELSAVFGVISELLIDKGRIKVSELNGDVHFDPPSR